MLILLEMYRFAANRSRIDKVISWLRWHSFLTHGVYTHVMFIVMSCSRSLSDVPDTSNEMIPQSQQNTLTGSAFPASCDV